MNLILVSTSDAPDERTRNEWLDHQPMMNRELRDARERDDVHVYTKTKLRSYKSMVDDDDFETITLSGWWIDIRAAIYLQKMEVS